MVSLSMMGDNWLDDDVIAKLHQDFSSLSTMNRARDGSTYLGTTTRTIYYCIHLQLWADALFSYRY